MKVSKKFSPIIITIETKEEADILWHRLNSAEGVSFTSYRKGYKGIPDANFGYVLWKLLNNVYTPTECKYNG